MHIYYVNVNIVYSNQIGSMNIYYIWRNVLKIKLFDRE